MDPSLRPVNALATLLLLLGIILFNNSLATWQSSQYVRQAQYSNAQPLGADERESAEYHTALMRQALYIVISVFLMFLGIQMLRKRRWACHFFFCIRQLAQLALLLIPLGTLLLLLNPSLVDVLVGVYKPLIQEVTQEAQALETRTVNDGLVRVAIQISFSVLALLGMAIASLVLRLSERCLRLETREALLKRCPEAHHWSYFILCLPMEMLLVLLLSVYGSAIHLLDILAFMAGSAQDFWLFDTISFAAFSLALLELTNRNMQGGDILLKFRLLQKGLGFCSLAYLMRWIRNVWSQTGGAEPVWGPAEPAWDAVKTALAQINILSDGVVLLTLGWLYYLSRRSMQRNAGPPSSD
ncbi:MAG: hypothetical protein AAF975_05970 [Spirochaetota bacterium]